ncbi:uncharacterized protein LOC142181916 [Nicotiana tabacum]|uniref:Uncharacterized protein LOC142181916 n=1 Tax=Nicotiana tabacum TaxID=4097 RepID=A0AC58UQC8_TOBAC
MEENPFADIDEYIEDTNAIVPPVVGAATFKVEHGLILMLNAEGFFRNFTDDDPTQHLRKFLGVCAMHKQNNVSDVALRLRVFKYSLAGGARKWLQNMPPNSIHSWPDIVRAFLAKWFPQSMKSELRDKIFFFKKVPGEHLHDAWDQFKLYLVRSPNHSFPDSLLLEKFYMGLDPMNPSIANNAADGSFMDKSFARVTQILDKMAKHNQVWHSEDTTCGTAYGSLSLTTMIKENQEIDQVIAGLATNVNVLTKMFTESQTKKVNVVEDVKPISNEDFEEANYVNNSQGSYQRQQYQVEVEEPSVVEVEKVTEELKGKEENREEVKETPKTLPPIPKPPPPFPQRLARKVDDSKLKIFYDIIKQLSVNISFVEVFKEMPGFDKYLKDLITKKRTTKNEVVNVTHQVSSIFTTSTVQKKEDPGAFTIPCTIGEHDFVRALCDNGASINLMPLAIYKQAGLGIPRPTSMILQIVDRSIKRPVGIVDDVLVKLGKFHLPANFVILDCAVDKKIPINLGRPLISTGRALMDSERNEIKFCVNDEEVTFQVSKGMKLPHEYEIISVIDVIDEVEDAVEIKMEEQCLDEALAAILVNFDGEDVEGYMESVNALEGLGSYTYAPAKLSLDLENRATPPAKLSIIEPPQLELKPLPPHLRYKFLGSNDTLQVIVSSLLNDVQVEQLLEVLKEHRQAIGWTITNIQGIPARICKHKIQLVNETKPSVEHQRRLKLRMPFALCNAPTTFQRCMMSIFSDMVEDFLEVFMDDFLVVGDSFEHCLNNLRQVLNRCEETNLVLNWEKCHFMLDEGIVLGHKISKHGIEVDREKIEIISKLPSPTSAKYV